MIANCSNKSPPTRLKAAFVAAKGSIKSPGQPRDEIGFVSHNSGGQRAEIGFVSRFLVVGLWRLAVGLVKLGSFRIFWVLGW